VGKDQARLTSALQSKAPYWALKAQLELHTFHAHTSPSLVSTLYKKATGCKKGNTRTLAATSDLT